MIILRILDILCLLNNHTLCTYPNKIRNKVIYKLLVITHFVTAVGDFLNPFKITDFYMHTPCSEKVSQKLDARCYSEAYS